MRKKNMATSFILAAFSAAIPQSSPVHRYCEIGKTVCFTQDVIQIHLFSFWVCFPSMRTVENNRWCCWCINKVISHLFSGLWLEFVGIFFKQLLFKKKNNNKFLMLSFYPRCSAATEPVTI